MIPVSACSGIACSRKYECYRKTLHDKGQKLVYSSSKRQLCLSSSLIGGVETRPQYSKFLTEKEYYERVL